MVGAAPLHKSELGMTSVIREQLRPSQVVVKMMKGAAPSELEEGDAPSELE